MGLAPWHGHVWDCNDADGTPGPQFTSEMVDEAIFEGKLYDEDVGGLKINRRSMMGLPFIARVDPDMFDEEGNMVRAKRYNFDVNYYVPSNSTSDDAAASSDGDSTGLPSKQLPTKVALDAIRLASRVQTDLETIAMDFVEHFKAETSEVNLCLAGGVALNSVLNGRLSRELRFENTFIPPYPCDNGIAVGCCAFGLFGSFGDHSSLEGAVATAPPLWNETLLPSPDERSNE